MNTSTPTLNFDAWLRQFNKQRASKQTLSELENYSPNDTELQSAILTSCFDALQFSTINNEGGIERQDFKQRRTLLDDSREALDALARVSYFLDQSHVSELYQATSNERQKLQLQAETRSFLTQYGNLSYPRLPQSDNLPKVWTMLSFDLSLIFRKHSDGLDPFPTYGERLPKTGLRNYALIVSFVNATFEKELTQAAIYPRTEKQVRDSLNKLTKENPELFRVPWQLDHVVSVLN